MISPPHTVRYLLSLQARVFHVQWLLVGAVRDNRLGLGLPADIPRYKSIPVAGGPTFQFVGRLRGSALEQGYQWLVICVYHKWVPINVQVEMTTPPVNGYGFFFNLGVAFLCLSEGSAGIGHRGPFAIGLLLC